MAFGDLIPFLLQLITGVVVAIMLLCRARYKDFPFLTAYVFYSVIAGLVRLSALKTPALYFKVYWITEAADLPLQIIVVWHSLIVSFRGLFLLRAVKITLPILIAATACYSGWQAYAHPPVNSSFTISLIVLLEVFGQYLIAGLFCLFLILRKKLQLHAGPHYGVVLGFAVMSFSMLLATLVRSQFGTMHLVFVSKWSASVGYFCALFIWIASLRTPYPREGEGQNTQINAGVAMNELDRYASVLERFRK